MKTAITTLTAAALMVGAVQNTQAGDHAWALTGKILTGVVGASIVARALEPAPVYYAPPVQTVYVQQPVTYVQQPPVYTQVAPVQTVAPAPTVAAAPVACQPAPAPAQVVVQQPVTYVQPAPVVYVQPAPVYYYRPAPLVSLRVGFGPYYRHGHW
ncbi:MAG TPA: hypothetical protein VHH73_00260 [Verrucomicrobiae bacterium]|jgi:hypothetical protein|nr:hypothetical protein [Verrucomicrobiae bacterium]